MLCLVYDASFDGFLTAVFEAFRQKGPDTLLVRAGAPLPLLFENRTLNTDPIKAERVAAGIGRLGGGVLRKLYRAWLTGIDNIDGDILQALRLGFEQNKNPLAMRYEPCVARVDDADIKAGREVERYLSFVRFVRAGEDLFIADIEPQYDILPLIGRHFHLRYQAQRFLIRDLSRKRAIVSDGEGWHIAELSGEQLTPIGSGGEYERMWRQYFSAIANPSRKNKKLQQKFIPLRYRKYLTEFQE